MWMMGYSSSDGGDLNPNFQDSSLINSRRLGRPRSVAAASTNPPCSLFHGNDLFALNHHFAAVGEQNKRELNAQQVVVSSSRWNPAPEQVQALEELYRRGTRTPSAEEIQQITAQLRRYGKIEGKNVFYWFQNHKARERQKRRRQQLSPSSADDQQQINNTSNLNKDHSFDLLEGANRTRDEVEQTKYWVSPTCSSTIPPEKSVCSTRQGSSSSKAVENTTTAAAAESKADGWLLFDHTITTSPTTDHDQHTPSDPTHIPKPNFLNMLLLQPYSTKNRNREDSQTLQLFPVLRDHVRGGGDHDDSEAEAILMGSADHIGTTHDHGYQFFEFLPIKN